MVDRIGSYSIPFVVSMGLAGVGVVLSFFMRQLPAVKQT
jgi:hypothetical protein